MTAGTRVSLALGDAKLEIEGEKAFVEQKLKELLPLVTGSGGGGETDSKPRGAATAEKTKEKARRSRTLKSFIEELKPQNAYQAIAAVLYYKREHEDQAEMEGSDIRNGLRQGGYRPPGNISQALVDCRRKYGYIERGSARGMWKLVHQGEALVEFDLPSGAAE